MNGSRARLLDVLRGLLATWVVLFHLVFHSGLDGSRYPWRLFAHHGQEPVLVFFILSGFAITKTLAARSRSMSAFMIARFWRIYPVYVVALGVGICASSYARYRGAVVFPHLDGLDIHDGFLQEDRPLWLHLLLHLVQLHGLVPMAWLDHAGNSLVGPAWTLSTEFQFYLVAPAICRALRARRAGGMWIFAVPALIALVVPSFIHVPWIAPPALPRYADLFTLGMIGALTHESGRIGRLGNCLAAAILIVTGLVTGRMIVVNAVVVWMAFWWLSTSMSVDRLLDTRIGELGLAAGVLSFPVYIIHFPLERLLMMVMADLFPMGRGVFLASWAGATIALTCAGAWLLHRYVERPGTRRGKLLAGRFETRYRTPAVGLS